MIDEEEFQSCNAPMWTLPGKPLEDVDGVYDASNMKLLSDHEWKPLWVCPNGTIIYEPFLVNFSERIQDFLIAIAEPVSRPDLVHTYKITAQSLHGAVYGSALTGPNIVDSLTALSKTVLPESVVNFVTVCTERYCNAKLVLRNNCLFVESAKPEVLQELLRNDSIKEARKDQKEGESNGEVDLDTIDEKVHHAELAANKSLRDMGAELMRQCDLGDDLDEDVKSGTLMKACLPPPVVKDEVDEKTGILKEQKPTVKTEALVRKSFFEIHGAQVEDVKREARQAGLPLLEEYDYRDDTRNALIPKLNLRLKGAFDGRPIKVRDYQEKALSRMFGNGRARSGIIVLPCGAGKTLVGITAAQTIKRNCLVLCNNNTAADQWRNQFFYFTTVDKESVLLFTRDNKPQVLPPACVLITTYSMLSQSGERAEATARVLAQIADREWGLMLLDEVHIAPATKFRKTMAVAKAHCKLGLTATLVREDDKIDDLHYLIGPKLYEANWMDLTARGYLANVQCVEVWCAMSAPFCRAHLRADTNRERQLLYVMNSNKFRAAEFLVEYHQKRKDKVLLFSDDVWALETYCQELGIPYIHGDTVHDEREFWLGRFRGDDRFLYREFVRRRLGWDLATVMRGVEKTGETEVLRDLYRECSAEEKAALQVTTLGLSVVGDVAIDLPEANVLVQVASHFASRRQEAQRMGRILRPKMGQNGTGSAKGDMTAYFYSLVSTDTREMYFAGKRQQYLIDQGYTYKIVPSHRLASAGSDLRQRIVLGSEREKELLRRTMEVSSGNETSGAKRKKRKRQIAEDNQTSALGSNKNKFREALFRSRRRHKTTKR